MDMHVDPTANAQSPGQKSTYYHDKIDNMNWVLDQTEPLGVQISFLSVGCFMEVVVNDGISGMGVPFLQRIYANGGQIGSHSHSEHRAGFLDWPNYPDTATFAECTDSWQDNIDWVNQGIVLALGLPLPEPIEDINCVKGSHLPKNEPDYHSLMKTFGMQIREGGAEEDFYGLYEHFIWNPFRPSPSNYMAEDLSAPFVVATHGSVIGLEQVHHGITQDMRANKVKRRFIQIYLNWRYNDRLGLPEKVWSWGWGSHGKDYDPGAPSRGHMVDVITWLDKNFVGKIAGTGSQIMKWSTQRETAEDYFAWETAHPGISSMSAQNTAVDWADYPYLRAVCEELSGWSWSADLSLGSGTTAFLLEKGPHKAVVMWLDAGSATVDLSSYLSGDYRVVDLETGIQIASGGMAGVTLGGTPLIATEETYSLSVTGSGTIGTDLTFEVIGPKTTPAAIYTALAPDYQYYEHWGNLQIDPTASLNLLASGATNASGRFSASLTIPNNPSLIGITGYAQGCVYLFDSQSLKLTYNRVAVTIN